ncbi:MAG: DUF721 domain-containing protein [Neisseriaceae bacterium]|nr:DUF721 domain-containing protein [Neisseriaceae bacterium]
MELEYFRQSKQKDIYDYLLSQWKEWQRLTHSLQKQLPANLSEHYKIVCVQNDELVIYANNSVVANRLKMLLPNVLHNWKDCPDNVTKFCVKLDPQEEKLMPTRLYLSESARKSLLETADKLSSHQELSHALRQLSTMD